MKQIIALSLLFITLGVFAQDDTTFADAQARIDYLMNPDNSTDIDISVFKYYHLPTSGLNVLTDTQLQSIQSFLVDNFGVESQLVNMYQKVYGKYQ